MGKVRSARVRWRRAGVAALVVCCAIAAGLLAAAAPANAARQAIGPIFQQSKWVTTSPVVKPKDDDAREISYSRRVLLNKAGGGGTEGERLTEGRARCTFGDFLLAQATGGFVPACIDIGGNNFTFLDPRIVKGPFPTFIAGPKYSTTGNGVDSLKRSPRKTLKAVNRIAAWLGQRYGQEDTEAPPAALRMEAAIEILANPLIHGSTRETIVANILSGDRFSEPKEASDPRGREAAVISTPDRGRFDTINVGKGEKYRGKNTLFTRKLYFDPDTYELLASRIVLEESDLPGVRAFLREEGAPAVVEDRVFARPRQVRDRDYMQRRIPCEELGEGLGNGVNCFKIGDNDGFASIG